MTYVRFTDGAAVTEPKPYPIVPPIGSEILIGEKLYQVQDKPMRFAEERLGLVHAAAQVVTLAVAEVVVQPAQPQATEQPGAVANAAAAKPARQARQKAVKG
jgi:hypothetical protein